MNYTETTSKNALQYDIIKSITINYGGFFMKNNTLPKEFQETIKNFFKNTEDLCLSDWHKPKNPENAKIQKDYFQIIRRNSNWRDIDFHFEIAWWNYPDLDKSDIFIHLETKKKKTVDYFKKYTSPERYSPHPTYYCLLNKTIDVNFTSEEETVKSLEKITEILRNSEFKRIAETADACPYGD